MYFVLNWNRLVLLSFYALPSGGIQKMRWSIDKYKDVIKLINTPVENTHFNRINASFQLLHERYTLTT